MKKSKKSAAKSAVKKAVIKTSKRTTQTPPASSEVSAFMIRVAARLEAIETKLDQLLGSHSHRTVEPELRDAPKVPAEESAGISSPAQPGESDEMQPQIAAAGQQTQGRSGRRLFQAVCADCSKSCEIPFQPTGGRPVFCKECFAKRKAAGQAPKSHSRPGPSPEAMRQRQLRVIPNGVGKVTISEMVPATAQPQAAHDRKRNHQRRPASHSKARH